MDDLPAFSHEAYRQLLAALQSRGASFHVAGELPSLARAQNFVVLRHDIDCHPLGAVPMAELEAEAGVCSTWYILMTAPYNPRSQACRSVIQRMVRLGHEVGLHYDLSTYPAVPEAAAVHLRKEAAQLSEITGVLVRTISCHAPHRGLPDPFETSDEFVNCRDPRYTEGVLYVSDSCRAWRDDNVLLWLHRSPAFPQRGLQFLTHPELWRDGRVTGRMEYLDEVLLPLVLQEGRDYVQRDVRDAWLNHEGARLHDARTRN